MREPCQIDVSLYKSRGMVRNEHMDTPTDPELILAEPLKKPRFALSKKAKIALWIVIPVLLIGLVLFGLERQGFVSDWFNLTKKASATIKVTDEANAPLKGADVLVGQISATTDDAGQAKLENLLAGTYDLKVSSIGYVTYSLPVKLNKKANDLGIVSLKKAPPTNVTFSLKITNYITNDPIIDANISLDNGMHPSLTNGTWVFKDVPVGIYKLSITKPGFNNATIEAKVGSDIKELSPATLVPSGQVIFESNRDGGKRGVFTASYDGANQQNLVPRVGEFEDYSPILGPNQKKVVFSSTRDGEKQTSGSGYKQYLYIVDIDGKNLLKVPNSANGYEPKWSPDGGYIGFNAYDPTAQQTRLIIYSVTKKTEFTVPVGSSEYAFSSEGSRIAFAGSMDPLTAPNSTLYYSLSTGADLKQIDTHSPHSIAFTGSGSVQFSYYDGAADKRFEYNPATTTTTGIPLPDNDLTNAVFSPSKKQKAYVSSRDGKTNLYISDASGKNESKLTTLDKVVDDNSILWSATSDFIMFNYRAEGESARYVVAANGNIKAQKIVDVNLSAYQGY